MLYFVKQKVKNFRLDQIITSNYYTFNPLISYHIFPFSIFFSAKKILNFVFVLFEVNLI